MEPYTRNGSVIGKAMDFGNFDRYIVGTDTQRTRPVLIGSQTYAREGATSNLNIAFNLTGDESTPSAGDVVVLAIALGAAATTLMTAPSGYTQLAMFAANDTYDSILYVGYKIMGSTPDTTFPIPSALSTANSQTALVYVWRGVDLDNPIDVTTTTAFGTNSRAANPPAITPTTVNSVIMAFGAAAHAGGGTILFTSSDLANFRSLGANDTNDCSLGGGYFDWVSGTFDPAAFTISGSTTSDSWTAVTLVLRAGFEDLPIFGNLKRSAIWDLPSVYNYQYSEYLDSLGIKFVGSVTTSTTTSITLPSGLLQNDIVFIVSFSDDTVQNLPTGYTNGQNGLSNSVNYRWSYKTMGVTPDSTATGLSSTSVHVAFAVRNVDTSVVFDNMSPTITTSTTGMPAPPQITTQTAFAKVITIGFLDDDILTAVDTPINYDLLTLTTYGTAGAGGTVMIAYRTKIEPGLTTIDAFGGIGNDSWVGATFALKWNGV
jgi:hypothetical protein